MSETVQNFIVIEDFIKDSKTVLENLKLKKLKNKAEESQQI